MKEPVLLPINVFSILHTAKFGKDSLKPANQGYIQRKFHAIIGENESLTFSKISSIIHRGGAVGAWEQTKFDLIIEFQLLTKFSIHSSTASWLN